MKLLSLKRQRPLRIGIQTLGCRLNQYESDGIIQRFIENGNYIAVPMEEGPDIAIINTCTVTDQADTRNRNMLRQILKKNPNCRVIMTGCYAQTDREYLVNLPGVDLVVGNDRKSSLFQIVQKSLHKQKTSTQALTKKTFPVPSKNSQPTNLKTKTDSQNSYYGKRPVLDTPFAYGKVKPFGRTRAYIKIQDGCDKKCTYCKIPIARGRGISRNTDEIINHIRYLEDLGVPEIVLTGVNLGWYRERKKGIRFIHLLEKILDNLGYARLRLSSIEPCDVDANLAEISLHPRFCNFLHVPLQSGSETILKRMKRSYSPYSFSKRIEKVKQYNPNIFLGTDVIIGFPGETQGDFIQTIQLIRDLEISNIHSFRFSARTETPAFGFSDRLPHSVIHERMTTMQKLRFEAWQLYAKKQKGKTYESIIEKITAPDFAEALTDNYLRVRFPIPSKTTLQKGNFIRLRIGEIDQNYILKGMYHSGNQF